MNETTFTIETITPEMARGYLEKNIKNRKPKESMIPYLLDQMRRGEWRITNDAICFDKSGMLINGQHRLMALVEYGKPLEFLVGRGLDEETFAFIDRGSGRSVGDSFQVAGIKNARGIAAMIRKRYALKKNRVACGRIAGNTQMEAVRMNDLELIEEYMSNATLYDSIFRDASVIYVKDGVLSQSELSGYISYLVMDMRKPYAKVVSFFSGVCSFKDSENKTVEALRTRLLKDKISNTRMLPSLKQGLIIKAWNCYEVGRQVARIKYDPVEEKDLWFR